MFDDSTYTLTDFVRNSEAHVERLKREKTPEVLTIDGSPELVVQDAESYRELLARVERSEFLGSLRVAIQEADDGKAEPADAVFRDLKAKHGF